MLTTKGDQAPVNPTEGDRWENTGTGKTYTWNGRKWKEIPYHAARTDRTMRSNRLEAHAEEDPSARIPSPPSEEDLIGQELWDRYGEGIQVWRDVMRAQYRISLPDGRQAILNDSELVMSDHNIKSIVDLICERLDASDKRDRFEISDEEFAMRRRAKKGSK